MYKATVSTDNGPCSIKETKVQIPQGQTYLSALCTFLLYYYFNWNSFIVCSSALISNIFVITSHVTQQLRNVHGMRNLLVSYKSYYCIPKLVRPLWLVSLAVCTLLHGRLKFKVFFVVAKLLQFAQLMKQITV